MSHGVFAIQGQSAAADLVAKVAVDMCTFLAQGLWRLWRPRGVFRVMGCLSWGFGELFSPCKGSISQSRASPWVWVTHKTYWWSLHHASWLPDGHLRSSTVHVLSVQRIIGEQGA